MTPLRERWLRELALRGMSDRTVEAYLAAVVSLAEHYGRSPDRITDEELQSYLLHLREVRHLAPSSLNQHVSALRRFYQLVLDRPIDHLERLLPRVRQQTRRPQVFSRAELEKLFTVGCPEIRTRAFLMTVYGAGLRLGEACHLKLLGHSSLASTTTYLHVREERLAQLQGPLQQLNLPPLPGASVAAA